MQDAFYDALAPFNHLLFADWRRFQNWQLDKLAPHLPPPSPEVRVIDCASGIGTQLLPLAAAGYSTTGVDSSLVSVERARRELRTAGLRAEVVHADICVSSPVDLGLDEHANVALLMDNYLTHAADDGEALAVLRFARNCLTSEGRALIALRDYDETPGVRPMTTAPAFYLDSESRRLVHQVWDWRDDRHYDFHLHFAMEVGLDRWNTKHFVGRYRPIARSRAVELARDAGFRNVELVPPSASGFHQWILDARA